VSFLLWNVQGLRNKLNDADFVKYISDFDFLFFTETWSSEHSNTCLNGYEYFNCPRPKFNKKAKGDSGGVIVYYKPFLAKYIHLIQSNEKGIIWIKLSKDFMKSQYDLYFCICYVPPEDSTLYRNINSPLFDFDLFDQLSADIRKYDDLGIVYLLGDLNSRTGTHEDFVTNIMLDRFVDLPLQSELPTNLPKRCNDDKTVNTFGLNLLNLCKESDLFIVNGRLESGLFTLYIEINR
jgi:exonuclease III